MAKVHLLKPTRDTLHGYFDKNIEPAITIFSGDTVHLSTLDSAWGIESRSHLGARRKKFTETDSSRVAMWGHSLVGPIAIKGAKPGMTLQVKINELIPGNYGWSSAGGFTSYWNERLDLIDVQEKLLDFKIDSDKMVAKSLFGNFSYQVPIRPFMGIMGLTPAEKGRHTTSIPRFCGGNLDCKELTAGTSIFLPIAVEGALFSVGDGHAVQGDGEVAGPALECPMNHVSLTFKLRSDMELSMPRAKTSEGWITFGFHEDLDEAVWIAVDQMISLMMELYDMSRTEAVAFASLSVNIRVTQVTNGVKGIHAILPFSSIK